MHLTDRCVTPLLSSELFSVDGTLIETWASIKNFRATDSSGTPPGSARSGEPDFHGKTHRNDTHGRDSVKLEL